MARAWLAVSLPLGVIASYGERYGERDVDPVIVPSMAKANDRRVRRTGFGKIGVDYSPVAKLRHDEDRNLALIFELEPVWMGLLASALPLLFCGSVSCSYGADRFRPSALTLEAFAPIASDWFRRLSRQLRYDMIRYRHDLTLIGMAIFW